MNKWEQLNSQLADAHHYAADIKEELTSTQQQLSAAQERIKELETEIERGSMAMVKMRKELLTFAEHSYVCGLTGQPWQDFLIWRKEQQQ